MKANIDPPQPKFKQGDKVYWNGKKHTITEVYPSHREYRYNMTRPMGDSDTLVIGVAESDLRLWKEHELTHWVDPHKLTIHEINPMVSTYGEPKYIGQMHNKDVIIFDDSTNRGDNIRICLGKKGDIES